MAEASKLLGGPQSTLGGLTNLGGPQLQRTGVGGPSGSAGFMAALEAEQQGLFSGHGNIAGITPESTEQLSALVEEQTAIVIEASDKFKELDFQKLERQEELFAMM